MNFSGLLIGSRLRSFVDMVEEGIVSAEDAHKALMTTWGDRIEEWGWDKQQLFNILSEFE